MPFLHTWRGSRLRVSLPFPPSGVSGVLRASVLHLHASDWPLDSPPHRSVYARAHEPWPSNSAVSESGLLSTEGHTEDDVTFG